MHRIIITSTFDIHWYKARKESLVPTLLLFNDFIIGHYEAIITKNKSKYSSACAMKCPKSTSFSIWNSDLFKNSLCSVCKKIKCRQFCSM